MKKILTAALLFACLPPSLFAELRPFVRETPIKGDVKLFFQKKAAMIYFDQADFKVVAIAAADLAADVERVTGVKPVVTSKAADLKGEVVIIGTLGKKGLVDQLVAQKKLNAAGVAGKWEAFVLQTVFAPRAGVMNAFVIAGSDRRGTAYGVYELSRQIGVSPWYWWADVPVRKRDALCAASGRYVEGGPAVKYRGIFLNDEAPALTGWAGEKFGGLNGKFYKHVFELLLRLRANYMWPAMWGNAFYLDDPANQQLADDYAIVMGTSHHEPMTRAQQEWKRIGKGAWNYDVNAEVLKDFWRGGVERIGNTEVLVTIGMRGDGDEPMTKGENIPLLEKIVADQRAMIAEAAKKKPEQVPQIWALYKEVQDYYDKGMRVPDDVTLLLCDDNWGNIRRLPPAGAKPRPGGYGIYYHFDYVGAPRNYKWINTNPLPKVWEQMHLAYEFGARQVWIVNVGDLKPMELPISFFLEYAWNPAGIPAEKLADWTRRWAAEQFGPAQAGPIAKLLSTYAKYNGRRKPEIVHPKSFSLVSYREAERWVADYKALAVEAEKVGAALAPEYQDAYFQLVLYPIKACANYYELYTIIGMNYLGQPKGKVSANDVPAEAQAFLDKDAALADEYHRLGNGRWNRMMSQMNIGYIGWQEQPKDALPRMRTVTPAEKEEMGVMIEGTEEWWPSASVKAVLPEFNSLTRFDSWIDVYRRGTKPFDFTVKKSLPWIVLSQEKGRIDKETRIKVSVDWDKAPKGEHKAALTVSGAGINVEIEAALKYYTPDEETQLVGYVETDGCAAIEAEHFEKAVDGKGVKWRIIPDYGRTLSGITVEPVTAPVTLPGPDAPRLEYRVTLVTAGEIKVLLHLSPTLDFLKTGTGLRYAVAFDDAEPQLIDYTTGVHWDNLVSDNAAVSVSKHKVDKPGVHVLKIWRVDPGFVLQRVVIDAGKLRPSYLGPPESPRRP